MAAQGKETSAKYRRVVVTRHGGPEVLQVVQEDLPEPQAGEARVKVLAAGISAYDLMLRRYGRFLGSPACGRHDECSALQRAFMVIPGMIISAPSERKSRLVSDPRIGAIANRRACRPRRPRTGWV